MSLREPNAAYFCLFFVSILFWCIRSLTMVVIMMVNVDKNILLCGLQKKHLCHVSYRYDKYFKSEFFVKLIWRNLQYEIFSMKIMFLTQIKIAANKYP